MLLCDIVFPLNLSFLTYRVPEHLASLISPGKIVEVPLRGKSRAGLVIRCYEGRRENLKEILRLYRDYPDFPGNLITLLEWTVNYYFSNEGTVLKSMHFRDFLYFPKKRAVASSPEVEPTSLTSEETYSFKKLEQIIDAFKKKEYQAFLLKPESIHMKKLLLRHLIIYASAEKRVSTIGEGIIVLSPEIKDAERMFSLLSGVEGLRTCLFHGNLNRSIKASLLRGIARGEYDIVVGTRGAVFSPFKRAQMIIVLDEHSHAYKQEESPRYNARDVAVMRGYLEKAPVVLLSQTPSVESYYNCQRGKYTLIDFPKKSERKRVWIFKRSKEIIPFLTEDIYREIKKALDKNEKVMLIHHRLGYSMLICEECDFLFTCPTCEKPLILHKNRGLVCHHCGRTEQTPSSCKRCGSFMLKSYGAGIELLHETLREKLEVDVKIIDETDANSRAGMVLGTIKKLDKEDVRFKIIALLNPDLFLNLPEFRSLERLVQEVFYMKDLLSDKGKLILLTSVPWHPLFRFLKNLDYRGFIMEELKLRRLNSLPPFTRLTNIYIHIRREEVEPEALSKLKHLLRGIERIGPAVVTSTLRGYRSCIKFTLKEADRNKIAEKIKDIERFASRLKGTLRIDVDPLSF
jgi:primosomal protein N' (replication factor Y)